MSPDPLSQKRKQSNQLQIALALSKPKHSLSERDRGQAIAVLATLLLEAAGVSAREEVRDEGQ